jgi:hypothetical protein
MFEYKPDYEEVLERYEAWWNCAIVDRPLVDMKYMLPKDERKPVPQKQYENVRDRWMDAEHIASAAAVRLGNAVHFADSLPVLWPNLGPEIFSAFYGCELEYGERTAWSTPILSDWSEESVQKLQLNRDSFYFKKLVAMTETYIEIAKGKFIIGMTDLHGGGDAIAAFRDPQDLLMDTIENPEAIKNLCGRITTEFLEVYDFFYDMITAAGMPSTAWLPGICKGKYHIPSNDFSCMISDDAFEDLFIPDLIRECAHMDRCIYHLDGPQALRYLDRLLEIPEIHAIQWVPGAGQDYWGDWIEVYQRIQSKKKGFTIGVPLKDLDRLFEVLSPEGVFLSVGVSNREQAEAALSKISAWTKRQ